MLTSTENRSALPVAITGGAASRCPIETPLHIAILGDRSPWTLWLGRLAQEAGLRVSHMRLRASESPSAEERPSGTGQSPALVVLSLFEADSPLRSMLPATNRLDAESWRRRVSGVLRHAGSTPLLLLGDPVGHAEQLTAGLTLGAADVLTPPDLGTPAVTTTRLLRLGREREAAGRSAPWRETNGRIHAGQLAAALGVSLRRLSRVTPVTHQALSAHPTSPRAQAALEGIALMLERDTGDLSATERARWAGRPHDGFGGGAPRDVLTPPSHGSTAPTDDTASTT